MSLVLRLPAVFAELGEARRTEFQKDLKAELLTAGKIGSSVGNAEQASIAC